MPEKTDNGTVLRKVEDWMDEVTSILCYLPEVPMQFKQDLANTHQKFKAHVQAIRGE